MPRRLYSEEHEDFRAAAREFVERNLKPRVEEMIELKSIPRDIWLEAGKQGLLGLDIPEEFGGAGAEDYRFNAVLAEEWAHFNAATAACFGIHADVCPPYIVDLGTEEQKARWLPGMATGELICAIGMTEPSGGSDLAALKTTAVRADDGSGDWIVNGSKTFITNGYQCDLVIVAARTDASRGPKGITLFMVERGMEGFVNGRKLDKVGQDESDTAELFFENVRVPDANRLGPEGAPERDLYMLLSAIEQLWQNYYHLGEERDLAFNLGVLLFRLGQVGEALEFFTRSLETYGPSPLVLYNIALCLSEQHKYSLAWSRLKQALSLDNSFEPALQLLKEIKKHRPTLAP